VKELNLKKIDSVKLIKEKLGISLINEAEVKHIGRITQSFFGISVYYYAKITLPVNKIDEFREKNYTSIEPGKFDNPMFGCFDEYKNDFDWWNYKREDTDYYLSMVSPSTTMIFCKPLDGKVDVYLAP